MSTSPSFFALVEDWWNLHPISHGLMMKLKGLKSQIRIWNNTHCLEASNLLSIVIQLTQLDDLEDRGPPSEEQLSSRVCYMNKLKIHFIGAYWLATML